MPKAMVKKARWSTSAGNTLEMGGPVSLVMSLMRHSLSDIEKQELVKEIEGDLDKEKNTE